MVISTSMILIAQQQCLCNHRHKSIGGGHVWLSVDLARCFDNVRA